jgi:hypothetical protein
MGAAGKNRNTLTSPAGDRAVASGFSGNNIVDASSRFTQDGVADYLPFISNGEARLIMALTAYFDESERDEVGAPICVGGFVFKVDGYRKCRRKMEARCRKGRSVRTVPHDGPLRRSWRVRARQHRRESEILDGAVDAIRKHSYAGIGVKFARDEFTKAAPPDWPTYRGSIYTAACHLCVQGTAH